MASWVFEDEWVDLPGPADWWPEDDNMIDATGFYFSSRSSKGHEAAIKMAFAAEEPKDGSYQRILPSKSELFLMKDTMATQKFLRKFFREDKP